LRGLQLPNDINWSGIFAQQIPPGEIPHRFITGLYQRLYRIIFKLLMPFQLVTILDTEITEIQNLPNQVRCEVDTESL
jgi:hypothetical protein